MDHGALGEYAALLRRHGAAAAAQAFPAVTVELSLWFTCATWSGAG